MKILLIILGAPVWLPLLITLIAVIFSAIVSLWAIVVSLWAGFIVAAVGAPASVVIGVLNIIDGSGAYGSAIIALSIGFVIAALILFYVSLYATKWMSTLTRKIWEGTRDMKYSLF